MLIWVKLYIYYFLEIPPVCQKVWIQIRLDCFVARDLGSSCLQTQPNLINPKSSGLFSPKLQRKGQPKIYIVPVVQMQMILQMKNSYKI